ncbi:hypothetical protein NM688_g7125 [Phlebia brevispora]|uniref:Uncharacterized protein n=1 Tax=Phlebia brevispora TaxID=194682 RepID=A0ACC1S919_9APHY|nr:hypothetical protein NM688_g7125 [Phlebia brevispora]
MSLQTLIPDVVRLMSDRPTTPQDSRPSPRHGLGAAYPLSIPQHPRVPPPAVPGAGESRERSKRTAGKMVPSNYVIAYKGPQNPGKESTVPQSPPGAGWAPRLVAKSMNDLRAAYKGQTPPSLQAGRRAPASPLPVSSKPVSNPSSTLPGLTYNNPNTTDIGYHEGASTLDLGLPKSYDGSRGPLASPTSTSTYYPPRQTGRPPISYSAYQTLPLATTQRLPHTGLPAICSLPNGTEYTSPEAALPRVSPIVPTHFSSSSTSGVSYRDDMYPVPTSFGPRPLPHPKHERAATESLPIVDRPVQLSRMPRTPPRSPVSTKTPPLETRAAERNSVPEALPVQRTLSSLPVHEDDGPSSAENTVRHDDVDRYRGMLENINSGLGTVVPLKPRAPDALPRTESPTPSNGLSSSNVSEEGGTCLSSRTTSSDESDREAGSGTYWAVPPKKSQRPVLTPIDTDSSPSASSTALPRDISRAQVQRPPLPQYEPQPPMYRSFGRNKKPQDQRTSRFDNNFDYTWAPRPPPEEVFQRLEEYFPEHDVDEPVIEAASGGTSPTSAEPDPLPQAERRFKHKKSIRVVAAEHKRRIDRTSRMDSSANAGGLRKRNTKLWGSRLEEVTTDHAHGHHETHLSAAENSPGPAKPIFRWVRGELIGKGTYGKVYLALNATTGEMIAVKQVEMPRTASDKDDSRQISVVEALKLESETLKDLDHPNIVQYLGFEETPTFLSIFLEYVPGGSIASCLRKHGKFDEEVTKSFTGQILSGLEYLHSKGILHRDLKADNILVETSGICKISDFGISKRTDNVNMAAYTSMQGTVFWMAPEVIDTKQKGYNSKIDIWSVGCVVFEMWTGQRPWNGKEAMAVLLQLYQTKQGPPVPKEITLSPLADDFRRKCFATNPDERPSAAELRKHPYLELQPDWTFNGFK